MNVIVYSTKNCKNCAMLKHSLRFLGILYEEKSLEDPKVLRELLKKGFQPIIAPILEVNGMIFEFRWYPL